MQNEPKRHYVKNTPFFVYYGGALVEGQLKWVIDSDSKELLHKLIEDVDQLWIDKYEAKEMAAEWWMQNKQSQTDEA